jgi:hypothetical protein
MKLHDCHVFPLSNLKNIRSTQERNRILDARQYLGGLLSYVKRKNIEGIGEGIAEVDCQSVHYFVIESQ